MSERRWAPILLVLLAWAAHGFVLRNGFVIYDDGQYLTLNTALTSGTVGDAVRWAFTTTSGGNWHPVTWISHLADMRLFGLKPAAHHAVSLAIHSANAALLFSLLRGMTGAFWPSALVAALFATHPLHVESVAWAAERKDVLSTFFALCAALLYLRGVRRPGEGAHRATVPLLFALALLAKPMPVTLPVLLLLLDWWPLGRWAPRDGAARRHPPAFVFRLPPAELWVEKTPLLLLAAVSSAVTWIVQANAGAMRAAERIALPARAANAAVSYARYLCKALWPDDLAVFYPYPWKGHPPLAVALALALLAVLTALAVRESRRRPWLLTGLIWYVTALLPVIGLVQVGIQAMADRYAYLPLVGGYLAAAWTTGAVFGRSRRLAPAAAAACAAVIGLLASLTARQVGSWRDEETLFSRALAVTKDNFVAYNHLGFAIAMRGRNAEALPHFAEAVRIAPWAGLGYQNYGKALAGLGRHEEAIAWYRGAISHEPSDMLARRNLALSLEQLGRREEALAVYREALRLAPNDTHTLDMAGMALARAGRLPEALPMFEQAARLEPGNAVISGHLAKARDQMAARGAAGLQRRPQ